jgi:hypothetical protein
LTSGLKTPLGVTLSNKGNLFVSETGTGVNDGRISIVDRNGNRRTLLEGLPSGISDVGDASGPGGIFLQGRTLYLAIGIGDAIRNAPGGVIPNPAGVSSPIFSSVLAIKFGDDFVERKTAGFTLSLADHQDLAAGERVRLSNGGGDKITVQLVVNFPDFTSNPLSTLANSVRGSNPFDLVAVGDRDRRDGKDRDDDDDERDGDQLYVTDGGQNLVWRIDVNSGAFSILSVFPLIPNPLAPLVGPFVEAVPTGIAYDDGKLLVTLFRGAPFPPGTSVVEQIDPLTGSHFDPLTGIHIPFIIGRKTAIDVLPISNHHDTDYLVLQHASAGPFFGSPGLLLRFETPTDPPVVITNCLTRPTSMALDERTDTLYISELAGRIVKVSVP